MLRPKYKVGYKTVTDLAWRCCPGLAGEGCPEHLTDHAATPPQPEPEPQLPSGQVGPGPRPLPSSRAASSPHGESAHGDPRQGDRFLGTDTSWLSPIRAGEGASRVGREGEPLEPPPTAGGTIPSKVGSDQKTSRVARQQDKLREPGQ